MKKVFFAALLLAAFSNVSFSGVLVANGKTHSGVGDYRIELSNKPVTINGEQLMAYTISYENSPLKVTVAVQNREKCKSFIVLSDRLSIQYVCNENYFGVTKLDKSMEKEGLTTSDAALNRSEYFHQKVIAPGKGEELENIQLIAAYFPMLIKADDLASM